jgi:acetolactate synthase-1/2/3 large subunit
VRLACTEKPGACLIELPEDIAESDATTEPIAPRRYRRAVPDDKIVDRAWDAIRSARRPIILAGNGCIRRRATRQLRRFVEKTGIGVVTTFMAKGCVDMDSEECVYTIGLGSKDYPAVLIEQSDLVISLGYDMVEYPPKLWNPKGDHRIVHADFIPAEIDEHYRIDVELVGDLAHTLWMLNERVDALGGDTLDFDHSLARKTRELMKQDFESYASDDTEGTIKPQKALWDARQVLGPEDILLTDVGAHKMWTARYYHCHEPNTCLIPNGFCSMGFALPGAVAASLVHPARRVLGVAGDAAFLMNVQEMETARRLDLNFTMLVWEDFEYGLIAWKQWGAFGRHTDLKFGNPDWVQLAQSFGWNGYRCENSRDLKATLEESFAADGPSLVVIPIDYAENRKLSERLGQIDVQL